MGYTTDFIGHIDINPPLNLAEQQYLSAFSASRRFDRSGGPYEVPGNPAAERDDAVADIEQYNSLAPDQPSLWCGWQPCWDGCCLSDDGVEKFYGATAWMAYLIEHFLAPDAHAKSTGLECFSKFTFDHVLNGTIAACRRDTRELYLIEVERNVVSERTLVPARYNEWEQALPYEKAIDDQRVRRRGRASKASK